MVLETNPVGDVYQMQTFFSERPPYKGTGKGTGLSWGDWRGKASWGTKVDGTDKQVQAQKMKKWRCPSDEGEREREWCSSGHRQRRGGDEGESKAGIFGEVPPREVGVG